MAFTPSFDFSHKFITPVVLAGKIRYHFRVAKLCENCYKEIFFVKCSQFTYIYVCIYRQYEMFYLLFCDHVSTELYSVICIIIGIIYVSITCEFLKEYCVNDEWV